MYATQCILDLQQLSYSHQFYEMFGVCNMNNVKQEGTIMTAYICLIVVRSSFDLFFATSNILICKYSCVV